MNDDDVKRLVQSEVERFTDVRINRVLSGIDFIDPKSLDSRLKSSRHENADHLDRALLVSKLKPSTTSGDSIRTGIDGTAEWAPASAVYAAGMYLANSGAPTHTSSGGWQKVGSGGGTGTWVSYFDVRPSGVSAQVDTATNKRIDIRYSGLYQLTWSATFNAITDGKVLDSAIYKNGVLLCGAPEDTGVAHVMSTKASFTAPLVSGDYLELYANQNDSASEAYFTTDPHCRNYLHAVYLGDSS